MARFPVQNTATAQAGNIVRVLPRAAVSIVDADDNLVTIHQKETGGDTYPNPFNADESGNYLCWLEAGQLYRVTVTLGGSITRYTVFPTDPAAAQNSADDAATSAGEALGFAGAADGSAGAAQGFAQDAADTAARIDLGALDQAVTDSDGNATLAQAWAESPTEPDGAGTKSAKTWAAEAAANATNGTNPRASVAMATTANITLSGEQTIDGILTNGNAVLVRAQTSPAQNGVYVTAAGTWTRRSDMDAAGEITRSSVYVTGGTVNGGSTFYTASVVATLGTDPIVWTQMANQSGLRTIVEAYADTGDEYLNKRTGASLVKTAVKTYGATDRDATNATASSSVLAIPEMTANPSTLVAFSGRFGGSGTCRILVYVPVVGSETTWKVLTSFLITISDGLTRFAAGGGIVPDGIELPARSFIACQWVSGSAFIRYDASKGDYVGISSNSSTVGTVVTRSLIASRVAISLSLEVAEIEPTASTVKSLSANSNLIGTGGTGLAAEVFGSAIAQNSAFLENGDFFASDEICNRSGMLSYVAYWATGISPVATIRHYRKVGSDYQFIAEWPVSAVSGRNVFVSGVDIPAGIQVYAGDVFACRGGVAYTTVVGGSWLRFPNTIGLGAICEVEINANGYNASVEFAVGDLDATLFDRVAALEIGGGGGGDTSEIEDRLTATSRSINTTNLFISGDSTVAAYAGGTALAGLFTSARSKVDISDPGDTIAQQRSALALLSVQRDTAAYAMLQIGLNDLTPGESAAVALARLQALVGDFRAKVGRWTPIFLSQMIPCRSRLISIYGGTNGPIAYQKWLDMNQAIAGLGATPITGVDARITAHVALMNDGSGNLKPIYDTGDGIHPNNAGRQINVDAWQAALLSYGLTA